MRTVSCYGYATDAQMLLHEALTAVHSSYGYGLLVELMPLLSPMIMSIIGLSYVARFSYKVQ